MKVRILIAAAPLLFLSCINIGPTVPSGPRLLQCPNYWPKVGTLVADPLLGGVLTLDGTTVSIPAGAVSSLTTFIVTIPTSQYMEVRVVAEGLTSFLFNTPITMSIDYSRCTSTHASNKILDAWHINTFTKAFIEDMNGTDDKEARTVTFQTGHLSGYALAY
jgi:hypothetical protein